MNPSGIPTKYTTTLKSASICQSLITNVTPNPVELLDLADREATLTPRPLITNSWTTSGPKPNKKGATLTELEVLRKAANG